MTPDDTHEATAALLAAAALRTLDAAEMRRVEQHVAECTVCAERLAEYDGIVAGMLDLVPGAPLDAHRSAAIRGRLLARAMSAASSAPGAARGSRAGALAHRWSGWAVAAGLTGVLLIHHGFHRPLAYGWIVAGALVFAIVVLIAIVLVLRARMDELRRRLGESGRSPRV